MGYLYGTPWSPVGKFILISIYLTPRDNLPIKLLWALNHYIVPLIRPFFTNYYVTESPHTDYSFSNFFNEEARNADFSSSPY